MVNDPYVLVDKMSYGITSHVVYIRREPYVCGSHEIKKSILRQSVVQARWVQGKEWYNLAGSKGACCYPIEVAQLVCLINLHLIPKRLSG